MSIKVMSAVWDHSRHKGSELLLLLALADFAHDDGGGIYPSVRTMAGKVRLTTRAVQYTLNKLLESGELVHDGTMPSGVNRYKIDLVAVGYEKIAPPKPASQGGATGFTPPTKRASSDPSPNRQQPSGKNLNPIDRLSKATKPSGIGRR